MPHLDSLILDAVEERILPPDRLCHLLEKLIARRTEFASNVDTRLANLRADRAKVEASITNLYRLAKTGDLGIDEGLSTRIQELRASQDRRDDRACAGSSSSARQSACRANRSVLPHLT